MWHYIYKIADGTLVSETSRASDVAALPNGTLAYISRASRLDGETEIWDAATHSIVARPARQTPGAYPVVDALLAKPTADWTNDDRTTALKLLLRANRKFFVVGD